MAGAIAGGLLAVPMGALLARVWDEAQALGQMGLLYLHNPNFAPKAIAYFDRAIAVDPDHAHYYTLRGVAWSRMNDPQRAIADWDKASTLNPDDPEPHLESWHAPPGSWGDNRGDRVARVGTRTGAVDRARCNAPSARRVSGRATWIVRSSITIGRSSSTR